MEKTDFKKTDKAFYSGKKGRWDRVDLPQMQFLMINGQGDPGSATYAQALAALYPLAYGVKFLMKSRAADFVVPPLEALWWADDMTAFVSGDRQAWKWAAMIRMPNAVMPQDLEEVRIKVMAKMAKKPDAGTDGATLRAARLESYTEGDCLQVLHIGPYADEAPVLAELHNRIMPDMGLTFGGKHHEIYLGDPRRVAPEKLKTILRQPVRSI